MENTHASWGRKIHLAIVLIALPVSAVQTLGQSQPDPFERTVAVSIVTDKWKVVDACAAENFRGRLSGEPIRVLSSEPSPPHRTVILLDTSGSMLKDTYLPSVLLAKEFLTSLPATEPIAFMTFSEEIEERTELSLDHAAAEALIGKLESQPWDQKPPKARRETALMDALDEALTLLSPASPGDAIALISDGGENKSKTDPRELEDRARKSGIRFFLFITTQQSTAPVFLPLGRLPELTGGDRWVFDMRNQEWLNRQWLDKHHDDWEAKLMPKLLAPARIFAGEVSQFCVLRVRLPKAVAKPTKWTLEVVDPATGKPDHHLILHYPSQLMPLERGGP